MLVTKKIQWIFVTFVTFFAFSLLVSTEALANPIAQFGGGSSHSSGDANGPIKAFAEGSGNSGGLEGRDLQAKLQDALKRIEKIKEQIAKLNSGQNDSGRPSVEGPNADRPREGGGSQCLPFERTLQHGSRDANTGGEVSRLQEFLADDPTIYPEGEVTGYFGDATRKAVKRFQEKQGVANSGDEGSTGFGLVGKKTRDALAKRVGDRCVQKKDIFKVSDIEEIVVTTEDRREGAKVAVELGTSTDLSFNIASTTRARMVTAIGVRLDNEYRFKFATSSSETTRYKVLESLIEWKKTTSTSSACREGNAGSGSSCGRSYSIDDVESIVMEHTKGGIEGGRATTTKYTVTLDNGKKRTFVKNDSNVNPFSAKFTEAVRKTGYTGDITALLAKATLKAGRFGLSDISTVVVDSSASAHDGPFKYKVTLKNGGVVKFEVCSFCAPGSSESGFRKAGYTGDVAAFRTKATEGSVLGASVTNFDAVFEQILKGIEGLEKLVQ